jgi:peptidoglycan hydrolase CwlO-like protein
MKYYGERTNKLYETEQECLKAEFAAKEEENRQKILAERRAAEEKEKKEKAAAERKELAAKVEEARKAMVAAQKTYRDTISEFVKKYGSYHWTSNSVDDIPKLFEIFNPFFKEFL